MDGGKVTWARRIALLVAAALVAATFRLQVLDGSALGAAWERQVLQPRVLAPRRGDIRDRDGVLIAGSRLMVDVSGPGLEGLDAAEEDGWYLDLDVAAAAEILRTDPSARLREREGRFYPFGRLLSHVVGFTAPIGPNRYEALRDAGYRRIDRLGATGLEAAFETALRGRPGQAVQWTVPGEGDETEVRVPAVDGADLTLTISVPLQIIAFESLVTAEGAPQEGVVIIADPTNGDILAMASRPSYDPEPFLGPSRWSEAPPDPSAWGTEYIHRATQGVYPPASTFKIIGATVAMEDLGTDPYKAWNCKGWVGIGNRIFKGWKEGGLGWLDLPDSLSWSCDETFYYLAMEMEGPEHLAATARDFGFGAPTGLPIPEAAGLVPDRAWRRQVANDGWYTGHTANMIIGQGDMLATPVQVLASYMAIAGPDRIAPRLVRAVGGVPEPIRKGPTPVRPATREILLEGLQRATLEGTASRCCPEGTLMWGKTGTAQAGEHRGRHGWFVGFGEIEVTETESRPIMVLVLAEHGGSSSVSSVPITRNVLAAVRDHWRALAGVG